LNEFLADQQYRQWNQLAFKRIVRLA